MDAPDLLALAVSQHLLGPRDLGQIRDLIARSKAQGLDLDPEVVLISRGFLSTDQIRGLRQLGDLGGNAAGAPAPSPPPEGATTARLLLGDRIQRAGMVAPAQIEECLRIQDAMRRGGVKLRIGEILVSRGFLAREALEAFLLVHHAREAEDHGPEEDGEGSVWAWLLGAGVVLLLAFLALVVVALTTRGAVHAFFARWF